MARRSRDQSEERRRQPARTSEARELELSAVAYDLAEEQMRGGTASSQVVTHFLKMGSTRERLEQQRIAHENELLQVKRQAIESQKRVEELYMAALDAMRSYAGSAGEIGSGEDED